MYNRPIVFVLFLSLAFPVASPAQSADPRIPRVLTHPRKSEIDSMVTAFYQQRGGRLAWTESGRLSSNVPDLAAALGRAWEEGLDSRNYGAAELASVLESDATPTKPGRVDSALTRAFLSFALDLSGGRVRPQAVHRSWRGSERHLDLVQLLEEALARHAIPVSLRNVAPTHAGYVALRDVLVRYHRLTATDWPRLAPGPAIRPGAADSRVAAIRRRLALEGYAPHGLDSVVDFYDGALEMVVRSYQEARGLEPDGIIGAATLASLNTRPEARTRQIAANLERWRWLPDTLERPYVMVNTGGFVLEYVTGEESLISRAIVGRADWPTPIVSSQITAIVFRPTWSVPPSIAGKELLPLIKRNPAYLGKQGIRVFKGSTEINPAAVSWQSVRRSNLSYRFVQDPGPENPLGGVKFIFQTPFGVYLHDTPGRSLFVRPARRFSHGCVRIERAAELAMRLLPDWSADSVLKAMSGGPERHVTMPRPIPVHLVYWTAWVDADGVVQFRDDGYGWDRRLVAALASSRGLAATSRSTSPAGAEACGVS